MKRGSYCKSFVNDKKEEGEGGERGAEVLRLV
jgi:hypothetical protein